MKLSLTIILVIVCLILVVDCKKSRNRHSKQGMVKRRKPSDQTRYPKKTRDNVHRPQHGTEKSPSLDTFSGGRNVPNKKETLVEKPIKHKRRRSKKTGLSREKDQSRRRAEKYKVNHLKNRKHSRSGPSRRPHKKKRRKETEDSTSERHSKYTNFKTGDKTTGFLEENGSKKKREKESADRNKRVTAENQKQNTKLLRSNSAPNLGTSKLKPALKRRKSLDFDEKDRHSYTTKRTETSDNVISAFLGKLLTASVVHESDMSRAREVVEALVQPTMACVKSNRYDIKFGDSRIVGSTSENLNVLQPDDFDVHIPMDVGELRCHPTHISAYEAVTSPDCNKYGLCDSERPDHLSAPKVVSKLQGIIHSCTPSVSKLQYVESISPGKKGPAAIVYLDYTDPNGSIKKLKIDFVPIITCGTAGGNHNLVAKQYKLETGGDLSIAWRASFAEQERAKINNLSETHPCVVNILRIMKTITKSEESLQKLSSYHIKTVIFHLTKDTKWSCETNRTVDIFYAFIEELQVATESEYLPNFFKKNANLFGSNHIPNPVTLKNIASKLKHLLENLSNMSNWLSKRLETLNTNSKDEL